MKRVIFCLVGVLLISCLSGVSYAQIDINTATISELQTLPRIGPGLAQAIIDYREAYGPFQSAQEITNVPSIGAKTFEQLRDKIYAGNAYQAPKATSETSGQASADEGSIAVPYTPIPKPTPTPEPSVDDVMSQFANEPGILEVQNAAIEYAEIDPARFSKWRRNVRDRGLWPDSVQVSVGHDTDDDEDYTRSKTVGISGGSAYVGPDDETWGQDTDNDWDYELSLRWNLQDYVFHTDMLRVSSETEDQVEFRQEILEDVTKVYFDRRRLQVEMILMTDVPISIKMKRIIQLEQYTALLDGFTGGFFSTALENKTDK